MTSSLFVLFGMVMLYLLIKHMIHQIYPDATFYVTLVFLLLFLISSIQILIPILIPFYEQLPVAEHPLIRAFLVTFTALLFLEIFQAYLQTEDEHAISRIIEIVVKCFVLIYWIANFQQMR